MIRSLLFSLFAIFPNLLLAQSYDVEIFANVPGCGDNIIQVGEQCDGTNLGGTTCALSGFDAGTLSCSSICTLVTAACVINPPQGGGTQITFNNEDSTPVPVMTNLVVTGYSAPFTRVSLLKDGVVSATVFSDARGYFQATLSGLSPGDYLLKLSASGEFGKVVITDSFVGRVYKDSTTKISGVVLPPFGTVTTRDGLLVVNGQAVPGAAVLLEWEGMNYETAADTDGRFVFTDLKASAEEVTYRFGIKYLGESVFDKYQTFGNVDVDFCDTRVDVTSDCKVNFVDFAITLWWYVYNRAEAEIDFDGNGRLDLVDFSILAYYWTG